MSYLAASVSSTILLKWPRRASDSERDQWRHEVDLATPPQADWAGQHRQDEYGAPAPQLLPGHHLPCSFWPHRPRRGFLCGQRGPWRKGTLQKIAAFLRPKSTKRDCILLGRFPLRRFSAVVRGRWPRPLGDDEPVGKESARRIDLERRTAPPKSQETRIRDGKAH